MGDSSPAFLNSRGDRLSAAEHAALFGDFNYDPRTKIVGHTGPGIVDPSRRAEMLFNWLTAGGAPKPLDPSAPFAEAGKLSPLRQKALAGMGEGGLFGLGKMFGGTNPASPMQAGVPYSVPPLPNSGGTGMFGGK